MWILPVDQPRVPIWVAVSPGAKMMAGNLYGPLEFIYLSVEEFLPEAQKDPLLAKVNWKSFFAKPHPDDT